MGVTAGPHFLSLLVGILLSYRIDFATLDGAGPDSICFGRADSNSAQTLGTADVQLRGISTNRPT